jgi:regulator of CtrA degradation
MGTEASPGNAPQARGVTISFGERFAASEQFEAIFKEGMALVERTAAYLDGAGRREARRLRGPAALLYASESMRLTTRLLELASWLMIRRALKQGEITEEEACLKLQRVRLQPPGSVSHVKGFAELPERLRALIEASFALNGRVFWLDRALKAPNGEPGAPSNPIEDQMSRIEQAFSDRRRRAVGRSCSDNG